MITATTCASKDCGTEELHCQRCHTDYEVWFSAPGLWSRVATRGEEVLWRFLCPTCFIVLAAEVGIRDRWLLTNDTANADMLAELKHVQSKGKEMSITETLKKLNAEASPGPWHADSEGMYIFGDGCPYCREKQLMVAMDANPDAEDETHELITIRGWGHLKRHGEAEGEAVQKANADLIAYVRTNLPQIIKMLEAKL